MGGRGATNPAHFRVQNLETIFVQPDPSGWGKGTFFELPIGYNNFYEKFDVFYVKILMIFVI